MKLPKKIISVITPLSLLTLLSSTASADKFVMKDGTTINGSIISETLDSYKLRAEVSRNVYGEKTILKSKLSEIIKSDPSIKAFKKLTSILPTRDLMSAKDYEEIINSQVQPFIKEYPKSSHLNDAKEILNTLKNESLTIKSGGVKLEGKLHTADQVEANKYDVQATIVYLRFTNFAKKKQYRAALTTLQQLEAGYPDTIQCRKAQKAALAILPRYESKLQKLHDNVDTLIEKRKRALEGMAPGDKTRTEKIFAYEEMKYQKLLDQATANRKNNKWLPINSYFKQPIENNLKMVQNEMKRLNTKSENPTMDVGKLYRDTHTALGNGDYPTAKEHFDKFKRTRPPEQLINELQPKLEDAKFAMEEAARLEKEKQALAKKKAAEEKARLAKEKREASKNKGKKKKGAKEAIRDKQNLEKRLSQ